MRRKNTRNARKSSPEKSKGDSPKRSRRQSSRRRKRSSSRSSYDSEDNMQADIKESTQKDTSVNLTSEQNSTDGPKNYGELGDPARGRKHDKSKSSPGSETPERKCSGYDRPYSPSRSPLDKDDKNDFQDKEEEKEEKKNKGKSKGKNNSNIEQSSNNIEPETENENVQGTPQSPSNDNADNENVTVNDTVRSNLEEQEHGGTENQVIHDENVPEVITEKETHFESEYVHQNTNQTINNLEEERNKENEPSQNNKDSVENQDNIENKMNMSKESSSESNFRRRSSSEKGERSSSKRHSSKRSSNEDRSTTPEPRVKEGNNSRNQLRETLEGHVVEDYDKSRRKSCEENAKEKNEDGENSSKKKIILRRSPPENKESEKTDKSEQKSTHKERKSSTDESKKEMEAQETTLGRKFTLRRPTIDERCSIDEKIDRKPEDPTSENLSDRKRRRDSLCDDKDQDIEEKPQRTLKPVKLIRNWSQDHKEDSEEKTSLATVRKRKWSTSDWLNKLTSSLYKIDVDTIKIVCPSLQFLGENEVHLESTPKERKISERKVSVDNRSEDSDRPEYDKQTSEESSGEIKIELNPNIIAMNRKISIVDDTASKLRPPPSPAKHPTSDVLFITNLVRPFTVKQLKELLERTGKIREDGFWTDRIKSKCYVHYQTVEEAEATRNALHGVHWPIGNGKKLVIDYAKVEDLEKAKNPAPVSITIPDKTPEKENREPVRAEEKYKDKEDRDRKKRDGAVREWDLGKEDLRRGRTRSRSRSRERARKHSRRSYTPEDYVSKKQRKADDSVPQKLMDDLFLKTKATPSIYWQPLSPEEIATKQMQRLVRMEEHKRRIEETRGRVRDNRRGPFRRR